MPARSRTVVLRKMEQGSPVGQKVVVGRPTQNAFCGIMGVSLTVLDVLIGSEIVSGVLSLEKQTLETMV